MSTAIFVPIIVFMVVVAPVWIVFHYRSKTHLVNGLSSSERADLDEMIETANKMAEESKRWNLYWMLRALTGVKSEQKPSV